MKTEEQILQSWRVRAPHVRCKIPGGLLAVPCLNDHEREDDTQICASERWGALLKEGAWVCYVGWQPACTAVQPLCSSLLISKHLCGSNDRLSKSFCGSSSPRDMNLFVQKRTGLNQLIHFADIVGRNKYTLYKLPLSCFLARLFRKSNLILSREREIRAIQFCQERQELYRPGGQQTVLVISLSTAAHLPWPLSRLNTTSCTVLIQTFLLRFSC